MRKHTVKSVAMPALFILSSCLATQPMQALPALLKSPSADNRLLLESAIGDLLNSQPIKLADNVFTLKSTIIIEPKQSMDNRGNLLDGREIRQADTFTLLFEDDKCYLKHDQSEQTKLLVDIRCKAE